MNRQLGGASLGGMGTAVAFRLSGRSPLAPKPLDCLPRAFSSPRFLSFSSHRRLDEVEWQSPPNPL